MKELGIYALEGVLTLGAEKREEFFSTVASADGTYTPKAESLEFADNIMKLLDTIHTVAPVLHYLVKSEKILKIIQAFTSGIKP